MKLPADWPIAWIWLAMAVVSLLINTDPAITMGAIVVAVVILRTARNA